MPECIQRFFIRNGQLLESTLFDESFLSHPHYIYEVFRVIEGIPLFIEDHLERLRKTLDLSGHPPGWIPNNFFQLVNDLIASNNLLEGNLKVVLLPGLLTHESVFMIYVMEHQYPSPEEFAEGVPLALIQGTRDNPNAKLMDVQLRNAANLVKKSQRVYETLLLDQDKYITEGSRSNVFFVWDNEVITPPVSDVLPGVTRKHIMKLCEELGILLREEKVKEENLGQMDAVFITGTSRKVLPACRVDEWLYPPDHPVIRQLQVAFNREVENYIRNKKAGAMSLFN